MLGVKLQLVPWQGALIGASAGLLLGWRLGSLALIKRAAMARMQAYGAAFRAAFMIFLIMAASMFGENSRRSDTARLPLLWRAKTPVGRGWLALGRRSSAVEDRRSS